MSASASKWKLRKRNEKSKRKIINRHRKSAEKSKRRREIMWKRKWRRKSYGPKMKWREKKNLRKISEAYGEKWRHRKRKKEEIPTVINQQKKDRLASMKAMLKEEMRRHRNGLPGVIEAIREIKVATWKWLRAEESGPTATEKAPHHNEEKIINEEKYLHQYRKKSREEEMRESYGESIVIRKHEIIERKKWKMKNQSIFWKKKAWKKENLQHQNIL